jgi:PKD repeat protein
MSTTAPAAKPSMVGGWMKAIAGGTVGLLGGAATMYSTAIFDKVIKPPKPMANFATKVDGLTLTCESRATGESGWWDFGDGTALEPYQPNQTTTHAYAKPGNYSVKLTVRNFLSEENDRTVPVEVGTATASKDPAANVPVAILRVEPTTPNPIAPATFKVVAEVKNAEKAFIDVVSPAISQAGGTAPNKIDVKPAGGIIETLILVEKPGPHVIQLFGTKGNDVVRQSAFVTVGAPADGSVVCYLIVTDTGTRTTLRKISQTVPISIPTKGESKSFDKTITGLPGYAIQDVKLVGAAATIARLASNVKLAIAADRQSFRVTGDWNGRTDSLLKIAGGTDLMLPYEITYVQTEAVNTSTKVKASLDRGRDTVTLPPGIVGLSNGKRTIDIELCQYRATAERSVMANGTLQNGKLTQRVNWAGQSYTLDIVATDRQATVSLGK